MDNRNLIGSSLDFQNTYPLSFEVGIDNNFEFKFRYG
jgi:hypothetical protein